MNGEAESVLSLSGRSVLMLAASCGFAVANLYYSQPLLPAMAATFGAGADAQGAIAMLTQLGYACGLLLFGPLGDRLDRRRLIAGLLMANMAALALCAFAQNIPWLLAASVLLGLTAMSAQIIIPAVSGHVDPAQRGQTVGAVGAYGQRVCGSSCRVAHDVRTSRSAQRRANRNGLASPTTRQVGKRSVLCTVARVVSRVVYRGAAPARGLSDRLSPVRSFQCFVGLAGAYARAAALRLGKRGRWTFRASWPRRDVRIALYRTPCGSSRWTPCRGRGRDPGNGGVLSGGRLHMVDCMVDRRSRCAGPGQSREPRSQPDPAVRLAPSSARAPQHGFHDQLLSWGRSWVDRRSIRCRALWVAWGGNSWTALRGIGISSDRQSPWCHPQNNPED
jgi:hypothetical protein